MFKSPREVGSTASPGDDYRTEDHADCPVDRSHGADHHACLRSKFVKQRVRPARVPRDVTPWIHISVLNHPSIGWAQSPNSPCWSCLGQRRFGVPNRGVDLLLLPLRHRPSATAHEPAAARQWSHSGGHTGGPAIDRVVLGPREMLNHERREPIMMGFGMGGGMMAMTLLWVGLLVLVIWAVTRASTGSGGGQDENPRQETPEEILDRRYVAGELDEDTYRSMRETLTSARSNPR